MAAKLGEEVMAAAGEGEKDVVVGMLGLGRSSTATELRPSPSVPRRGGGEDEVPTRPPVRRKKGEGGEVEDGYACGLTHARLFFSCVLYNSHVIKIRI